MKTPKQKIADAMVGKSIRDAVVIASALLSLHQQGKIEVRREKEPEKSKFRPVLKRRHDAMPGEVRELEHSDSFKQLCIRNSIPCTHRQASKFLQKRGRAFQARLHETRADSANTMALLGTVR